jgi:hypothetical protein
MQSERVFVKPSVGQTYVDDLVKVLDVFDSGVIGAFSSAAQVEFIFGYKGMIYLFDIDVGDIVFPENKIFGVLQ